MLAKFKAFSDLAIPQTVSHQRDYVFFSFGEQSVTASVRQPSPITRTKSLQHVTQLFAIGPDLAVMHAVDALAQYVARFMPSADPHDTGAEGLNDLITIAFVQQHHAADRWFMLADVA
jgi:hypothetical protein